jgi:7-cyano-7-deazaguanine synthase|tara:strand:- start:644 stop:1390 length:747 start_codon:yes stop_codon:yes gene_type:complete
MSKKLVLSISGGMDSVVLLHMAVDKGYDEINLITFNYGQRHIREIDCIQDQVDAVKAKDPNVNIDHYVADVGFIKYLAPTSSLTNTDIDNPDISKMAGDAQPVSYVPFRNQLFNTIGCAYAEAKGADTVWYGAAEVDSLAGYWDGSTEFVDAMNALIALNRENRITIEAPLLTMSKEAIVEEGVRLGVDFGKTWTCYSNREDGLADATTPSSSMRVKGFVDAGYQDPIQYVQQDKLSEVYMAKGCKKI